MKIKNKMKKQLMGLLSLVMVFSLTSQNILYAMGETENESTAAYTNEYSDENVKINVHADGGVLPENAVLKVTPIEKKEINDEMDDVTKAETEKINTLHDQTNEKLKSENEENETSLEGFLAYDISFMVDGKEVEPNGNVDVAMQFINATKPEGVSKDSTVNVKHFKEINGQTEIEDITEKADITTTENSAIEKIALKSDSFSVFTIVWTRTSGSSNSGIGKQELAIKVVDQNGNEINAGKDFKFNFTSNNEVKIQDIAKNLKENAQGSLDDYCFINKAYVKLNNKQENTYFEKLVKWKIQNNTGQETGGFQAKVGEIQYNINDWKDENGKKYAYFIFQKKGFNRVNTIDSAKKGISIKMINNNGQQFDGATWDYNHVDIKQGILNNVLGEDGYPTFNKESFYKECRDNGSLKQYYDGATEANNLFLEEYYNKNGYFYYNSGENSASFNEETGNFNVYQELVTPKDSNEFYYRRGNFLPYATFNDQMVSGYRNEFDESGNRLSKDDPNYDKLLFLADDEEENLYHFGMQLETDFIQAEKGVYEGNPMKYEFTGDDDLWVYIDGVLVLDLGGCHDARSGSIDFATGEVKVQVTKDTYKTISLEEMFRRAGKYDKNDWQTVDGKQIFKDFTSHNMKMWYMERGKGASNLKIKFNLPVVPKDQIQIEKKLSQESDLVYGKLDFGFELYIEKTANSGDYKKVTNLDGFDAKKIGTDKKENDLTIENGVFYLQPNEKAIFNNIDVNKKYYVKEVNVNSDEFDKVIINSTKVVEQNGDQTNTYYAAESTKDTVKNRHLVSFTNSCNAKNKRTLSVVKEMKNGQSSNDVFKVKVDMENEKGELVPYIGKYKLFNDLETSTGEELETKDGLINIKVGQKICIYNILSDTKFKVTEENLSDKYGDVKYNVTNAANIDTNNMATGIIELNKNAMVKIENRLASVGTLEFTKIDKDTKKGLKYAKFALFTNENCTEDSLISESVSDNNGLVKFDISSLKDQNIIYLKEVSSPFGYTLDETIYKVTLKSENDEGTKVISGIISTEEKNDIKEISNTPVNSIGTTNVTVRKDWSNIPESEWEDVTVTLFGNGTQVSDSVTLNSENDWQYTWSNLPGDIKYTVEEKNPDGFVVSYDKGSSIVVDDNFTAITPNNETYFELGSNGVIAIFSNSKWYIWTTSQLESVQKQAMITQLNDTIGKGKEITSKNTVFGSGNTSYTFKKDSDITFTYVNGKLKLDFGNPNAWSYFFMGNYTENVTLKVKNDIDENKTINIPVEKVWEDNNSPVRPNSVEVQLYKKVSNKISKVDGKTMTLNESNNWNGVFENLPYWDTTTKTKINYLVKESKIGDIDVVDSNVVINGYLPIVSEKDGKFIITNVLSTGKLTINKFIVDSNINPKDGDPIFTFKIENEDKSIVLYRTIRLSETNKNGSIVINDLPLGKYTVTELNTMRYTCVSINPLNVEVTKDGATADFKNKITYDKNFSHTDVIENSFKVDQDGKVTVTKQVVPGTDLTTSMFDLKKSLNQLLEVALTSLN